MRVIGRALGKTNLGVKYKGESAGAIGATAEVGDA
jgi:hypothetical protein